MPIRRRRRSRLSIAISVGVVLLVLGSAGAIAFAVTRPTVDPGRALDGRPCAREYVHLGLTPMAKPTLRLEAVDTAGSVDPSVVATDPTHPGNGLLGDRSGRVARIVDGEPTDEVVLDFRGETLLTGDGGLLGLAYDPRGGWVYVYRATDEKDDRVDAYPLDDDGVPDQDGEVEVLFADHPRSEQHHGGGFAFGPDGNLWIGMGDGGGLGDPRENGQRTDTVFGKILRILPTPGADEPYAVPDDNPFVDDSRYRPEIWAIGLRNPFRLSFDEETDDLWVSDVGQACWEEINRFPAGDGWAPGSNLGWDAREGTEAFEGDDVGPTMEPVHVNAHRDGFCATSVGYVVHDDVVPGLDGFLLTTDLCKGRVLAFRPAGAVEGRPRLVDTGLRIERPVGIFEGPDGLPWVLSIDGDIDRITTLMRGPSNGAP